MNEPQGAPPGVADALKAGAGGLKQGAEVVGQVEKVQGMVGGGGRGGGGGGGGGMGGMNMDMGDAQMNAQMNAHMNATMQMHVRHKSLCLRFIV